MNMATKQKSLYGDSVKRYENSQPPQATGAAAPKLPYVAFAHHLMKSFDDVKAAIPGVQADDIILANVDGKAYQKLEQLKIFLVDSAGFFVKRAPDSSGKILTAVKEDPSPGKKDEEGRTEEVESAVLVFYGDRLIPATISWRRAMCRAPKQIADAIAKTYDAAYFGSLSDAHKSALAIPVPFARVNGVVSVSKQQPKRGGTGYRIANAIVTPTTGKDVNTFAAFTHDVDGQVVLDQVLELFNKRVREIQAFITGDAK